MAKRVTLHFIHPVTKGRAVVRVPQEAASDIRAVFLAQGYREVSAKEYRRFTRRWPTSKLDKGE